MRHWSDDFNTYEDACNFYGCDTPKDLAYEAELDFQNNCVEHQDFMESTGGPVYQFSADIPW